MSSELLLSEKRTIDRLAPARLTSFGQSQCHPWHIVTPIAASGSGGIKKFLQNFKKQKLKPGVSKESAPSFK